MEVPAYVTFHFINAYEEDETGEGKATVIIADCCEHNADTRILDMLRLHTLRSSHGDDVLPDARLYICVNFLITIRSIPTFLLLIIAEYVDVILCIINIYTCV